MFNVNARDNTCTVVKMRGCFEVAAVGAGVLAFAQNISFTMKTI